MSQVFGGNTNIYRFKSSAAASSKWWQRCAHPAHLWRDGRGRSDLGGAKYESLTENVDECPSPKSTHLCSWTNVRHSVRKLCVSKYPVNWSPLPATHWADLVSFEQTKSSVSRHGLKSLHYVILSSQSESSKICNCYDSEEGQRVTVFSLSLPPGFASCFICPQTRRKVMLNQHCLANMKKKL